VAALLLITSSCYLVFRLTTVRLTSTIFTPCINVYDVQHRIHFLLGLIGLVWFRIHIIRAFIVRLGCFGRARKCCKELKTSRYARRCLGQGLIKYISRSSSISCCRGAVNWQCLNTVVARESILKPKT
jgi:hypothetical protein